MRHMLAAAGAILTLVFLLPLQEGAARSFFSGVNSSSMERVQRERQERIATCARLHPNFDSGTMTYTGKDGRPHPCQ